ncbi:MAG: T9SS type A sorting domain-containing protein [Saprospiraceae bacterium]
MKNRHFLLCWALLAAWTTQAQNQVTLTFTNLTVDEGSCMITVGDGLSDPEEIAIAAYEDASETTLLFRFTWRFNVTAAGMYNLTNILCSNGTYTFTTNSNTFTPYVLSYEEDTGTCSPPNGPADDCVDEGFQAIDLTQTTGSFVNANGFQFNFTINSISLPVELTLFEAIAIDDEVLLMWETGSEKDILGFHVERSSDGRNWASIGFVEGLGQSDQLVQYEFFDRQPLIGPNYYRLRQMDFTSETNYSPVRSVVLTPAFGQVEIFPNPASEVLNIRLPEENGDARPVHILSAIGQEVGQLILENGQATFPVSNLPNGLYFLVVEGRYGLVKWMKN